MTDREIRIELKEICEEMERWPGVNASLEYAIPETEMKRRELVLIGQQELYRLQDAMNRKDMLAKGIHEATFNLIKNALALC
ncbi:MAG: hypothetical protein J7L19_02420 [Dehalococcoidia bacterium]|nr:hypothetical protein [Dehalococcoidia bacterium]